MPEQDLHECTTPDLVEKLRVRWTRIRSLTVHKAPTPVIELERESVKEVEAVLLERGMKFGNIERLRELDLTPEDVVGRPWCLASGNMGEAMLQFLRAGGTVKEILEHVRDTVEEYQLELRNNNSEEKSGESA